MRKNMLGMLDNTEDTISFRLLKDIREIFKGHLGERIFSNELVDELKGLKESPWGEWNRGKGLTQNGLARLLKPFEICSKTMRIKEKLKKGYELDSFDDAFKRYIPLDPPISTVTPLQTNNINKIYQNQCVTSDNDVTDKKRLNSLESKECYDVTDENPIGGKGKKVFDEQLGLWVDQ